LENLAAEEADLGSDGDNSKTPLIKNILLKNYHMKHLI
jgi:hypothetical protein